MILLGTGSVRAFAQQAAPHEAAQSSAQRPASRKVWGTIFVAPGIGLIPDQQQLFHWGGGVEWAFHKSIGIGAEMGALHEADAPAYPLFMLSVNGYYYFRDTQAGHALVPFITAGYTGASLVAGLDMPWFNAGAGANYWFKNRKGLRFDVRYQISNRGTGCFAYRGVCRNSLVESRIGFNF